MTRDDEDSGRFARDGAREGVGQEAVVIELPRIPDVDLDFHAEDSTYASHAVHAFAAKFPPQLPRLFIERLTTRGEIVLDPMAGSGTTLLEAYLSGRRAIGVDIDPLAVEIARAKTTPLKTRAADLGEDVVLRARALEGSAVVERQFRERFDERTRRFVDYWFLPGTQRQLMALVCAIERVPARSAERRFLEVAFSSTIVTKSGGVSLARDLAHTRPHRDASKQPKNAIDQFAERLRKLDRSLRALPDLGPPPEVRLGDARRLDMADDSVHLLVTSPPYANAIDYMRAHKFSLVWLGRSVGELSSLRARYVGAERAESAGLPSMPGLVVETVGRVGARDSRKAGVLAKYFCDMSQCLCEMRRVLAPGRAAVLVVGSSTVRGVDVQTPACLARIAEAVGFELVGVARRRLDRDRRMMPAKAGDGARSGIERRMHGEEVIVLRKPPTPGVRQDRSSRAIETRARIAST